MYLDSLRDPFPEADIEWRITRGGVKNGKAWAKCLAYVANRAVMDRLDEVCSPENWQNEYNPGPDGGVICGISIRINEEWVTKWDGSKNTDIESVKGGLSGSMKRAGVQWGIGRYLYHLTEGFAEISPRGKRNGSAKDKAGKTEYFKWDAPALPEWALPGGAGKPSGTPSPTPRPAASQAPVDNPPPPPPTPAPRPTPSQVERIVNAFDKIAVTRAAIESHIGHGIGDGKLSGEEMNELRTWYKQITDKQETANAKSE